MYKPTSPVTLVALFALVYAVAVLCIGIAPVNLMLRTFRGVIMGQIWLTSLTRLALQAVVAALACWVVLALAGRTRARLTGRGSLVLGAVASGALAGALDVVAHRLLVLGLGAAARPAPAAAESASLALTALSAGIIALLFLVRGTRVVSGEQAASV